MQINPLFKPVDAMLIRTQFGEMLDKVGLTDQRYVIKRRGKAKALLVPISDGEAIAGNIVASSDKVSQAHAALMRLKGIVKDPNLTDASTTIDAWVYGPTSQEVDV
jgi:hypothetical protein